MNDSTNTMHDDERATQHDYAMEPIEPYGPEVVKALPTNVKFAERTMPTIRLGAVTLTRTKVELMAMFAADPSMILDLQEELVEVRDYLRAMVEICDSASIRLLIAGSAVELAERGEAA